MSRFSIKDTDRYFSVGFLKRYEGHGWFLIDVLTDKAERLKPQKRFFLAPPLLNLDSLTIKEVQNRARGLRVKFIETEKLLKPEQILNRYLQIKAAEAKKLSSDEYWIHDIIGLKCFTTDGNYLGEVTSVMKTGANDVFIIDKEKYLIPAVKEVIR